MITTHDVESSARKIWPNASIAVDGHAGSITVTVSRMYDYVECGLKELVELARAFQTDRFHIDQSHTNGCETCDHGSNYEKLFRVDLKDIGSFDSEALKSAVAGPAAPKGTPEGER